MSQYIVTSPLVPCTLFQGIRILHLCRYPTLLAFCNGDASAPLPYLEDFKPGKMSRFLQQFKDGQKCSKMVKLDEHSNLGAMSVSQLKEFLRERGDSCIECTEKKDYIARLQDLIRSSLKTEL